ncbi:MAG: hypothetical protein RBR35_20245 [Salinivirgaceae bacterium]|nr:hypothetical protein [Salinivirgaceae bacterium]
MPEPNNPTPTPTPTPKPTSAPEPTPAPAPEPTPQTPPEPPTPPQEPASSDPSAQGNEYPEHMPENVKTFFKEKGFSPQQATEALNFANSLNYAEKVQLKKQGEKFLDSWGEQKEANLKLAKRALKQYDPKGEVLKVLNSTGYGNHPAILNFFYTLGKELKEGGYIKSEPHVPTKPRTLAEAMYGKTHPSKHN